jgi:hypothetical protein
MACEIASYLRGQSAVIAIVVLGEVEIGGDQLHDEDATRSFLGRPQYWAVLQPLTGEAVVFQFAGPCPVAAQ